MSERIENLLLIGVDGAIPTATKKLIGEGKLPHLKKLIEEGVFAENALPCFPTVTPPNWATIATGAWPGTHGITGYSVHHPGEPPNWVHWGFDSGESLAEFIWDVAERAGKKSILIKYPCSWPPTIKNGVVIDGCGPELCIHEIGGDSLFTTLEGYPLATKIRLQPALGWENMPQTALQPLEAVIPFKPKRFNLFGKLGIHLVHPSIVFEGEFKEKAYHMLVIGETEEGYNKVFLSKSKDVEDKIAVLSFGQWSDWIIEGFEYEGREAPLKGSFRFKLVELSSDAKCLRLYATQILPIREIAYPQNIGEELVERVGPFIQRPGTQGKLFDWIDDETYVELMEQQNDWFSRAVTYLMGGGKYFIYLQTHTTDYALHSFLSDSTKFNLLVRVYQSVDKMVGKMLEKVDSEKTLMIVVSDHGGVPIARPWGETLKDLLLDRPSRTPSDQKKLPVGEESFEPRPSKPLEIPSIGKILEDAGLLFFREERTTGLRVVDWNKTKAFSEAGYIWVNLKGREPYGIVERGSEYEQVCDEVVVALSNIKDPNGKRMYPLVLKREDARVLGLYGDRVGDVVYAVGGFYIDEHGLQLPTFEQGLGSMKALLIMRGPRIKRGYTLKRTVWLTDIAPTIAYLLGIPMPKNAEGAVIYDILENPNLHLEKIERLEEEHDRLRHGYNYFRRLSHI